MVRKIPVQTETKAKRQKRIDSDIAVVYKWDKANYRQWFAIRARLLSNPTLSSLLDSKLFCKERPNKPF